MEANLPITLETLSQWFLQSLSPIPEARRNAESSLSASAESPNFSIALLHLVSSSSSDPQIRLAAAINFKNLLKSRYPHLPDSEKTLIKTQLPSLMLSSPPRIQPQLSESLSIVSSHDFPQQWPSLLPNLCSSLLSSANSGDFSAAFGVLSAAASIFLKFRHSFDTPSLRLDLKYCLDNFASPLLDFFLKASELVSSGNHSPPLFRCLRVSCEIFYSLNSVELPEFFEDHMPQWMSQFRSFLTTTYSPSVEADEEGTADSLRAAICENLQLYLEKNEEEFRDYLEGFAAAVYNLLTSAPPSSTPARDQLTITAIKFLTTVSTSVHHALFGGREALQQICNSIVFPNLRARDEDEELFDLNHIEYIRRDIEGSDVDTRRRTVCELLKGLALNYKESVTELVGGQIQAMLARYALNPSENWKEKDCAIYLVVALGTKAPLVDVGIFFGNVIVPELQATDVNASPMLKAGALKFFTVFREQIPKQVAIPLLQNVIGFLKSESVVVHSYAANCIEKLLLVRDKVQTGPNAVALQPRYTAVDIDPYLGLLIPSLFAVLQIEDSKENQYVMKCIMRVVKAANITGDIAGFCINGLTSILAEVCKNPKSPVFNHYLFEVIAALIGRTCEREPALITEFELRLFPVLNDILAKDISEFWPYAFQIFAQLVELSQPPLSANYLQLFGLLLLEASWKRSANAPALVRLLQAFLQKIPNELIQGGSLPPVLGIFKKLIGGSRTEDLGFYVINTVVENVTKEMLQPQIKDIWGTLFMRLQNRPTPKFVNSFVILMSLVLVKHGHAFLVDSINEVQPNIFLSILQHFWIPNLKLISGTVELKLTAVASTRLICETPILSDPTALELWGKMLDSIITLLARPDKDGVELEAEVEIPENTGYSDSFARIQNAGKREDDPLPDIRDPKIFLVESLERFSAVFPGRYPAVIQQYVDPSNRDFLLQLCGTYNHAIV